MLQGKKIFLGWPDVLASLNEYYTDVFSSVFYVCFMYLDISCSGND